MTTTLAILLLGFLAEPDPVVLTGRVVGADGAPATGVEVILAEILFPPGGVTSRNGMRMESRRPVVLGRVRSDEVGNFALPLSSPDDALFTRQKIVWAYRSGSSAAFRPIPYYWPKDGEPIRLTLGPPHPVKVRVLGPDGQPLAGARVAPARLRRLLLHPALSESVAVEADAGGLATLTAIDPTELDLLRVTAGPFGTQVVRSTRGEGGEDGERVVRFSAVGRIEAQVKADDLQAVRGLPVLVRTWPDPKAKEDGVGGIAEAVTDDQGRFAIPAIAEGPVHVQVELRQELPFRFAERSPYSNRPAVVATQSARFEVILGRGLAVSGIVRQLGDGTPVAGAGVVINPSTDVSLYRTDDKGRYSGYVWPGMPVETYVRLAPSGYFNARPTYQRMPVPDRTTVLTLKPLELTHAEPVIGRVVGPDGKPVPGAEVVGSSVSPTQSARPLRAITDRSGLFRIEGVDPKSNVELTARRGPLITGTRTPATPGGEAVTLAMSESLAVDVAGRVVGAEGRPIAGAVVRLNSRRVGVPSTNVDGGRVEIDDEGREEILTDSDGRFRTPRVLRADLDYQAEVEAEGRVGLKSEWITPGRSTAFPDVVLAPVAGLRTVAGRVVDATGRPVAGATVFQAGDGPKRTSAVTDAEGRFQVPGIFREPAFLFVEGAGLRFGGHPIGPGDEAVELKAARDGEPAGRTFRSLPPVLPRDREKALARKLIEPEVDRLSSKDITSETMTLLDILPRVDPARAMELAEKKALPDERLNDQARYLAAISLIDESFDEGAAIVETTENPWWRAMFYRKASDDAPASDRTRKLEMLDKALAQAQAEPDPARRVDELGRIGDRLLDLGEKARGTAILLEGQKLVETLPRYETGKTPSHATFSRGEFAKYLARIDGPAALAIVREFPETYDVRYIGPVAVSLADHDAAGVDKALGLYKSPSQRDRQIERVAGRMVATNPARARQLVDSVEEPYYKARGFGAMARGLVSADPKAASSLLVEAYSLLDKEARGVRATVQGPYSNCASAVAMLPVVERSGDPVLLESCLWRAISFRPNRPVEPDPSTWSEETIACLAIGLSRYDRGLARAVLEPVARQAKSLNVNQRFAFVPTLYSAAAMIDPAWAVELAEALPDDVAEARARPRSLARQAIAQTLAHGGPKWWAFADSKIGRFDDDHPDER